MSWVIHHNSRSFSRTLKIPGNFPGGSNFQEFSRGFPGGSNFQEFSRSVRTLECVEEDMSRLKLCVEDTHDRAVWRRGSGKPSNPCCSAEKRR